MSLLIQQSETKHFNNSCALTNNHNSQKPPIIHDPWTISTVLLLSKYTRERIIIIYKQGRTIITLTYSPVPSQTNVCNLILFFPEPSIYFFFFSFFPRPCYKIGTYSPSPSFSQLQPVIRTLSTHYMYPFVLCK